MKFVTIRELRAKTATIRKELEQERVSVIGAAECLDRLGKPVD